MSVSPSLQRFLDRLGVVQFGEDRYPVELLTGLAPADVETAVDALIAQVAQRDDVIAARSLGSLGAAVASRASGDVVALARRVQPPYADLAWVAALALGASEAQAEVERILRSGTGLGRIAALLALPQYPLPPLVQAALTLLDDPDVDARSHAFDALVRHYDLNALAQPARSPLDTIRMSLLSDLPTLYRRAAAKLRAALTQLDDGETNEQAGLVYTPSTPNSARLALVRNLAKADQPLDGALIASFAGHDREWVEVLLAVRCGAALRDPRAPGALIDLGTSWAADLFDDATDGLAGDDAFSVAVALAQPRLWGDA